MKRVYLFAFGLALAALLVAQPAQAVVWNNTRPHPITPNKGDGYLWDMLDPYVDPVKVEKDWVLGHQTRQATFLIGPAYGEGGQQVATLLLEIAGHKKDNVFGIYDPSNVLTKIAIFLGDEEPITSKMVVFTKTASGTYDVTVNGEPKGTFASTELGFYLEYKKGLEHYLFYSEDSRNGDNPQSLILFGDSTGNTFIDLDPPSQQQGTEDPTYEFKDVIVAFEDLPYHLPADLDYQDMVVFIDFQTPGSGAIPEPTSLAIWGVVGLGAAGLASLRRRRKLARWSDQDRQAIVQLIQGGRQR